MNGAFICNHKYFQNDGMFECVLCKDKLVINDATIKNKNYKYDFVQKTLGDDHHVYTE